MSSQFLYLVRPTRLEMLTVGTTPDEERIIGEHFSYLQVLMGKGVVILAGRTSNDDETTFGIIIFNAESEAEAQMIVDNDPAVMNDVMSAELFPYRIALICEANA